MSDDKLTDEDRAALAQMMAKRDEQRRARAAAGPPAPVAPGPMQARWASEVFGGADDEDEGLNAPLPRSTPVGIVAVAGPGGVTLYRDGRCRFSIAIPGKPAFVAAEGGLDATCRLADVPGVTVSFIMLPPQPSVPLAEQTAALAGDITQAAAAPLALDNPGVTAGSFAVLGQDDEVRTAAVLAGGAAGGSAIVIVMIDHRRATADAATIATIRAALVGSAAFTPEPRRKIPALFPESAWVEPGLPLRPRAGHPAVPAAADRAALAGRLLAVAGDLVPTRPLDDATRAAAVAALGADGAALASSLATAHDLRGLARALLRG